MGAGIDLGAQEFESDRSAQVGLERVAFSMRVESGSSRLVHKRVTIRMGPASPLVVLTAGSQALVELVLVPQASPNSRVCVRKKVAVLWPLAQRLISVALCNPPAIKPVSNCQAVAEAVLIPECVRSINPGNSWTPEVVEQGLKPSVVRGYCICAQAHQVVSSGLRSAVIEGCGVGERVCVERKHASTPRAGKGGGSFTVAFVGTRVDDDYFLVLLGLVGDGGKGASEIPVLVIALDQY